MDKVDYEKAAELGGGDPARALGGVKEAFLRSGFKVTETGEAGFVVASPGISEIQHLPLLGASRARVTVIGPKLSVQAELGGIRRLTRNYLLIFLGGFLFFAALLTLAYWGKEPDSLTAIGIAFRGTAIPGLIVLNMVSRRKSQTIRALDSLLSQTSILPSAAA